MERLDDAERRRRLVARHHLDRSAFDVRSAVAGVVAMHSSDPLTPHLGSWARVPGVAADDVDAALYADRVLWRLHAMRRTLFVVPADAGPTFTAGAGLEVAARERRRLEAWLEPELDGGAPQAWLAAVEREVLAVLRDHPDGLRTTELGAEVPALATEVTVGSGRWASRAPVSSRVLFLLAMEGRLVRGAPAGSWRSSQYRWALPERWFGGEVALPDAATARVEIVRRYLASAGPATTTDVRWWTGWTAQRVAAALAGAGAVSVALDHGGEGHVLAGDEQPGPAAEDTPVVALLPGLDPTPMGWKEREWYLGPHGPRLFDRNGNVGPTVWVDGRVVGGWAQRHDGEVVARLLEDVGTDAADAVAREAAGLTTWLAGQVVTPRFRTPLERELAG